MSQLALEFERDAAIVATATIHAVLPDMTTSCGIPFLNVPAGEGFTTGTHWATVTCPWCHSLGRAWFNGTARKMQERQA